MNYFRMKQVLKKAVLLSFLIMMGIGKLHAQLSNSVSNKNFKSIQITATDTVSVYAMNSYQDDILSLTTVHSYVERLPVVDTERITDKWTIILEKQ